MNDRLLRQRCRARPFSAARNDQTFGFFFGIRIASDRFPVAEWQNLWQIMHLCRLDWTNLSSHRLASTASVKTQLKILYTNNPNLCSFGLLVVVNSRCWHSCKYTLLLREAWTMRFVPMQFTFVLLAAFATARLLTFRKDARTVQLEHPQGHLQIHSLPRILE